MKQYDIVGALKAREPLKEAKTCVCKFYYGYYTIFFIIFNTMYYSLQFLYAHMCA